MTSSQGFNLDEVMLALLWNSLDAYREGVASPVLEKQAQAFRVEAWVFSDQDHWPFAFVNVCDRVGVSVEFVRACVTNWRAEAAAGDPH